MAVVLELVDSLVDSLHESLKVEVVDLEAEAREAERKISRMHEQFFHVDRQEAGAAVSRRVEGEI